MLMKWINRIVYALVVAFGLMLVFNIVDSQVRSNVLQEEGLQAIADGDYDRLLAVRFYHQTKLVDTTFAIGDATFELYVYDAAYVREQAGVLQAYGGITLLFHQTGGTPLAEPFMIRYLAADESIALHMGFQVVKLPVYSGVDPETLSAVVLKDELDAPLTALELIKDETVLVTIPLSIEAADLTVHQALEDYIAVHGSVPKEAFDNVGVTPTVAIDTSLHVVFFAALYLIAVAIATYLFFVWKKQKLGRVKPTDGVLRDIQSIKR
jgi:hypothetical protein